MTLSGIEEAMFQLSGSNLSSRLRPDCFPSGRKLCGVGSCPCGRHLFSVLPGVAVAQKAAEVRKQAEVRIIYVNRDRPSTHPVFGRLVHYLLHSGGGRTVEGKTGTMAGLFGGRRAYTVHSSCLCRGLVHQEGVERGERGGGDVPQEDGGG